MPLVAKKGRKRASEREKERKREKGGGRKKKRVRLDYQVVTVASSHDNYWSKVVKWFSSVRSAPPPLVSEERKIIYPTSFWTRDGGRWKKMTLPPA